MEILEYLFAIRPTGFSYYTELFIVAGVFLVASIILPIVIKKNAENRALKKLFGKMPSKFRWFTFLLLFLIATRNQAIPYFSMRILLYLTVLWGVYLVIKNLYLIFKIYPEERAFFHRQQSKNQVSKKHKKTYSTSKKRQ